MILTALARARESLAEAEKATENAKIVFKEASASAEKILAAANAAIDHLQLALTRSKPKLMESKEDITESSDNADVDEISEVFLAAQIDVNKIVSITDDEEQSTSTLTESELRHATSNADCSGEVQSLADFTENKEDVTGSGCSAAEPRSEEVNVLQKLKEVQDETLEYQLLYIAINHLILSESEADLRNEVILKIESTIKKTYPDCQVRPFGSAVSGFCLRNSDLDLFVDLKYPHQNMGKCYAVSGNIKQDITSLSSILRREKRFRSSRALLSPRIPVVKIKDKRTRIQCDIQTSSKMGVKNSEFLAFCCELDERLLPLVCIVKYLCSKHGILGHGLGSHMSSYTLVLLILFFLQIKKEIPTVEQLQDGLPKDMIQSWNFAFSRNNVRRKSVSSDFSIDELLEELFSFYATFDFEGLMVCPLLGTALEKQDILQGRELPGRLAQNQHFCRSKSQLNVNSVLAVQDPFELNRNVAAQVDKKTMDDFVGLMGVGRFILRQVGYSSRFKLWMLFETGLSSFWENLEGDQPSESGREVAWIRFAGLSNDHNEPVVGCRRKESEQRAGPPVQGLSGGVMRRMREGGAAGKEE